MRSKVFISAPITVDWSIVQRFDLELTKKKLKVTYWERSSKYNHKLLDDADAVIFILPGIQFKATCDTLPIGLKTELSRAYALNKKIYVGYVTSTGSYNIYNADTDGKSIEGVGRTSNTIYGELEHDKAARKIAANSFYGSSYIKSNNPCCEIELPKMQRVYAKPIPSYELDSYDVRLLLIQ